MFVCRLWRELLTRTVRFCRFSVEFRRALWTFSLLPFPLPEVSRVKYALLMVIRPFPQVTPDERCILDVHPQYPNIAFAAGMSGEQQTATVALPAVLYLTV